MRSLRRWVRKARCRAKYGKACPHGGHYGGKRRSSMTSVLPEPHTLHPHPVQHHRAERNAPTAEASADA